MTRVFVGIPVAALIEARVNLANILSHQRGYSENAEQVRDMQEAAKLYVV